MIIDRIERLEKYQAMLSKIDHALAKVKELQKWEEGVRYPFDGGFVFFQKGETKPLDQTQFEAHKKHIDVQLVLEGAETIALEDVANLSPAFPYAEDKDVVKYDGPTHHMMRITQGMAYVCFPWDAHKAVFHIDQAEAFTKAVIKLEIEKR